MCLNTQNTKYLYLSTPSILWLHWAQIYVCVCKNPIGLNLKSKQIKPKISKISYRILDSTFQ